MKVISSYTVYDGVGGEVNHIAALLGFITIVTIVFWSLIPNKTLKMIPSPLVAVVAAMVISVTFQLPINHINLPDNIFASIQFVSVAQLFALFNHAVIISALTIALVASTESLLTATAVDNMVLTSERTNYNKELFAQGAANMVSGFVGGLPITGVIVRSAANVQAGAKTRFSGILHGVFIAVCMLIFPHVLELIPVSCLAAILVYTGCKLVSHKSIKKLWEEGGKSEVAIYVVTVVAIVMTSLLEGLIIGFVLATIKLLYNLAYLKFNQTQVGKEITLEIEGVAIFVNLPKLAEAIDNLPSGHQITIDFHHTYYIDHACQDLMLKWREQYVRGGGEVSFSELATERGLPISFKLFCKKFEDKVLAF